jgi:alpha-glucosidase
LIIKVFADATPTKFTLYEDDGMNIKYGAVKQPLYNTRTTSISQQQSGKKVTLVIAKASGTYKGALARRNNVLRLIVDSARATDVSLNGTRLPLRRSAAVFNQYTSGWYSAGRNAIFIKSGSKDVVLKKTFTVTLQTTTPVTSVNFVCDNGWTTSGESISVVGNKPELGNWDPDMGIKLDPSVYYEYIYNPPLNHNGPGPLTPKWTGIVRSLPTDTTLEWKCAKKLSSGAWQLKSGSNNAITLPKSGFAGTSVGSF